jgi:hypothetical protein
MPTFTLAYRHLLIKVLICIQTLFIFSTTVLIRHLWQLKTVVCLHWCPIHAVLFNLTVPGGNDFYKEDFEVFKDLHCEADITGRSPSPFVN